MAALRAGEVLGERFEIVGALGQGGMATVYLARDRLREQRVALKVLHPHLAQDPSMRARLRREVLAAARLRHPGALVAHELHELDDQLALSMPFHPGRTLAEVIATQGPLPPDQVQRLGLRLSEVLAEAHRHGVLHRDITPSNIMIDERGAPVLTDFGLARLDGGTTHSTGLLGTAGYTAPEVYEGTRADPRSDLYGLGAVLYEAATGQPPFGAEHPAGVLQRQLDDRFTPVRELRPQVPGWLAETISALLRANPDLRPQAADSLHAALAATQAPARPQAPPTAAPAPQLPAGEWTVWVHERKPGRARRRLERARLRHRDPDLGDVMQQIGGQIKAGMMGLAGLQPGPTPEEQLTQAVAHELALPTDELTPPDTLYARRFLLVRGVERDSALRLTRQARAAGFRARMARGDGAGGDAMARRMWLLGIAVLWAGVFPALMAAGAPEQILFVMIALTIFFARMARRAAGARGLPRQWRHLPVAFPSAPRVAAPAAEPAPAREQVPTRGGELARRAITEIDALASVIEDPAVALPAPAGADLRHTITALREQTAELRAEVDRLDAELSSASPSDTTWLAGRLDRLDTLARAGEPVDPAERTRIETALAAHQRSLDAAQLLEARLTAAVARLLEIASTATRARRELLSQVDVAQSADRLARELTEQAQASARARAELQGLGGS